MPLPGGLSRNSLTRPGRSLSPVTTWCFLPSRKQADGNDQLPICVSLRIAWAYQTSTTGKKEGKICVKRLILRLLIWSRYIYCFCSFSLCPILHVSRCWVIFALCVHPCTSLTRDGIDAESPQK